MGKLLYETTLKKLCLLADKLQCARDHVMSCHVECRAYRQGGHWPSVGGADSLHDSMDGLHSAPPRRSTM